MPKKVDHKLRREDFAKAAFRVIAQHGFAAATLREVAREANTSSALLVHYIKSKEELLLQAHEYGAQDMRNGMLALERKYKGIEALRRIVWAQIPLNKLQIDNFSVWLGFWEMAGQSPAVKATLTAGYQESRGRFTRLIRQAQELGEVSPDIDIPTVAWTLTALVDGLGAQIVVSGQRISAQKQRKYVDHWITTNLMPYDKSHKAKTSKRKK